MLGSSIQTVEYQQHSAPISLFSSQICDENKKCERFLFVLTFKILLRVRCVEHEYNLHLKPGMSQHGWLSLVVNRGFWYRETYWWQDVQGCTWSSGYFVRKILSLEHLSYLSFFFFVFFFIWFSYSNCLVEVKVQARIKIYFGGSMHFS